MKRISALVILLMLLSSCAAPVVETPPELIEPEQPQLQTITVVRGDVFDMTTEYGNVFIASQPVAFSIDGRVGTIHVVPGQAVKKGDVLATLDTESLQTQLESLQEQQADTSYTNALTNRNLEIDIKICRLNLDAIVSAHQEQMSALRQQAESLQASLDLLTQTNLAKLAVLEQEKQQLLLLGDTEAAAEKQTQIDEEKQAASQNEAQIQANLDAVEAQISAATAEHAAVEKLYDLDIKEAELDLKHAKQTQYRASLPLVEQIAEIQEKIEQATITAPEDGIVSWISSSAKVTAEEAFIYISDPDRKAVRTYQQDKTEMQNAQRIYVKMGDREYDLTFREPDGRTDLVKSLNNMQLTSAFDFEPGVEIPESSNGLVYIVHDSRENVLMLPANVLSRDMNGFFVLKITDGVKEKVYVKTGLTTKTYVEIVSGLEEGDVVYVAG